MLRLSPEGNKRFLQENSFGATFGGAEANVAVSLANLGHDVAFVSKVPDNAIGSAVIKDLRSYDVDTSYIAKGGPRLGIYYMEKGSNQRPSICIYDRAYSSFSFSEESDYNWDKIYDGASWFHFTGITPALGDSVALICETACREAKKRGLTISCDLNYRGKLWSRDKASEVMGRICSYVDVMISNEADARDVFGIESEGSDVESGVLALKGYEYAAAELYKRFDLKYVAFTLRNSKSADNNDWGGMLYNGEKYCYSETYHLTDIVDRVGGGDSFGAGLIHGICSDYEPSRIIEFAAGASALKHTIEGDYNLVSESEVLNLIDGNKTGRIQR